MTSPHLEQRQSADGSSGSMTGTSQKLHSLLTKHDELLARAKKLRDEHKSSEIPLRQAVLLKLKIMKLEMREERKAA